MSSKYMADYSKGLHCFRAGILVSASLPSFSSISPSSIIPAPLHPNPPPLFVHTDSSAYISKVMWNVTNDPPAASPLKSILCQKDKMSRGRIFSAAVWPRSLFVLLQMMICVLGRNKKIKIILPNCVIYCFTWRCCRLVRLAAGLRFYWGSHVDCVCQCVPQYPRTGGFRLDFTPPSGTHTHTHARFNPPPSTPYHPLAEQPRQH